MSNPNSNKTKNWLYRLKHLRLRRIPEETSNNEEFSPEVFRRSSPSDSDTTTCSRTRNSFRKSFKKMHTRVKSVFMHNSNPPDVRHTIHIPSAPTSSSRAHSRITLSSPSNHTENIYSVEPLKKPLNDAEIETPSGAPSQPRMVYNTEYLNYEEAMSEGPAIVPRRESRRTFPQLSEIQKGRVPKIEVVSLSNYYWYWGPITRMQAEDKLRNFPDGAFLIRDSSSDRYIFTMSFRSVGRTLHTRIELNKNGYSLFNLGGYHSVVELVDDALTKSREGVYCYTKSTDEISPNYPVRLTLPVSRYDKVPSLKHLSRFVIRQCININDIEKLALPVSLIGYLKEDGAYFGCLFY